MGNIHEESIQELLEMYYEDCYDELVFKRIDEEKIVAEDTNINKVIAVNLKKVGLDKKKFGWFHNQFESYNYEDDNPGLKYFPRKGFYLKNYCEFLISYLPVEFDGLESSFNIGTREVVIGEPSNMFKFIFNHITHDDHSDGWYMHKTISVKNISYEEMETILEQAMFYFQKESPSDYQDYPEIITFYGEDYIDEKFEQDEIIDLCIHDTKYKEAFVFYNEGRRNEDPLSFYRVLEYFFIVNQKEEIRSIVNNYNSNKDIDKLIKSFTNIYKNNEEMMLYYLLMNLSVNDLVGVAMKKNLIQEHSIEEFTKKVYQYRNSIVHAKLDFKDNFVLPTSFTKEDDVWLVIFEQLANKCLKKFC